MAKIEFPYMATYIARLGELNKLRSIEFICNKSLYEGAKILADEVQKEISGLKTELNAVQRKGLHEGLGIAHFWRSSYGTFTKIGFEGYNHIKTMRWPKGQPNAMIARSVQRGTSASPANRFCTRAAKKAKDKAINVMNLCVQEYIAAIMKDGSFSKSPLER